MYRYTEVNLNGLNLSGGREELYTHEVVAPANERAHLKRALVMKPMQAALTSPTVGTAVQAESTSKPIA